MPGALVPAAIMLAGRAAAGGRGLIPSIGLGGGVASNILKFLSVATAVEAVDQVLEMFGIDIIPDFDNPNAAAVAIIEGARSIEGSFKPTGVPRWVPEDWDMPGYFWTYDFTKGRGFWAWRHITQNMLDGAVEKALTPKTKVTTVAKTTKRNK